MSVSTLSQKISYDGDATATALAVPFTFDDESDLVVIEVTLATLFEVVLALNTNYTVSGGSGSTGTVTPVAVRPVTVRWVIYRDTSKTQGTSFPAGTRFPAVANETALDRLTRIAQDQGSEIDRSLKISAGDSPWVGELPNVAARAGGTLAFDLAGEPVIATAAVNTAAVSPFMETLLDDADAATALDTLGIGVMTTAGDMIRAVTGGVPERLPVGVKGKVVRWNGSLVPEAAYVDLPDLNTNFVFSGMLYGLQLKNNAGTPNTHVDISPGACRDSTNTKFMQIITTLTKRLDTTWVAGTGNGGRATAAALANDTWYHAFLIKNSGDYNTVDAGFDTSLTAANLLTTSTYTEYRRIGSIKTGVGTNNIAAFVQEGDEFLWATPPAIIDTTVDTSALQTLIVPPGVKVRAILNVYISDDAAASVYLSAPDQADQAGSASATPLGIYGVPDGGGNFKNSASNFTVRTDTSSRIRANSSGSATILRIATLGWHDYRGKNV